MNPTYSYGLPSLRISFSKGPAVAKHIDVINHEICFRQKGDFRQPSIKREKRALSPEYRYSTSPRVVFSTPSG